MRGCPGHAPTRFSTKVARGPRDDWNTMITTLRTIRWTALGLIVVVALGMAILKFRPRGAPAADDAAAGTVSIPAGVGIGGPFHLTDDKGHDVTDADYRG